MTDHAHDWRPVEGAAARYQCPCGAWGRRSTSRGGAIVAQKNRPSFVDSSPSVQELASELLPGGRAPSLDEQDESEVKP